MLRLAEQATEGLRRVLVEHVVDNRGQREVVRHVPARRHVDIAGFRSLAGNAEHARFVKRRHVAPATEERPIADIVRNRQNRLVVRDGAADGAGRGTSKVISVDRVLFRDRIQLVDRELARSERQRPFHLNVVAVRCERVLVATARIDVVDLARERVTDDTSAAHQVGVLVAVVDEELRAERSDHVRDLDVVVIDRHAEVANREPIRLQHEAVGKRFSCFRSEVRVAEREGFHLRVVGLEARVAADQNALANAECLRHAGDVRNAVGATSGVTARIGVAREALVAVLEQFEHVRSAGGFVEHAAETQPFNRSPLAADLVRVDIANRRVVRTTEASFDAQIMSERRFADQGDRDFRVQFVHVNLAFLVLDSVEAVDVARALFVVVVLSSERVTVFEAEHRSDRTSRQFEQIAADVTSETVFFNLHVGERVHANERLHGWRKRAWAIDVERNAARQSVDAQRIARRVLAACETLAQRRGVNRVDRARVEPALAVGSSQRPIPIVAQRAVEGREEQERVVLEVAITRADFRHTTVHRERRQLVRTGLKSRPKVRSVGLDESLRRRRQGDDQASRRRRCKLHFRLRVGVVHHDAERRRVGDVVVTVRRQRNALARDDQEVVRREVIARRAGCTIRNAASASGKAWRQLTSVVERQVAAVDWNRRGARITIGVRGAELARKRCGQARERVECVVCNPAPWRRA